MKIKKTLIFLLVLSMTIPVWGKLTPAQCWKKSLGGNFSLPFAGTSTYRDAVPTGVWTFRDGDLWWDTDNDVLYAYDGTDTWDPLNATGGAAYLYLTPSAEPDPNSEGMVWYDSSTDNLKYRNASAWVTIAASSSSTLDEAYSAGQGITVDAGALTLTTSASSDSAALAIVHGETGNYAGMTLTNASAYPGIQITSSAAGADITGTSATWSIAKTGAITAVGLTTTAQINVDSADVHFDSTSANKDILWDDNVYTFSFYDSVVLGFGNTATAPDVTMLWDTDSFNILSTASSSPLEIGAATDGWDVHYYFEDAGEIIIDYTADALMFTDDMDCRFGTGNSADGDFQISASSTPLLTIGQIVAGSGSVAVGINGAGLDWTTYGDTASAKYWWDTDVDQLVFEGAAEITLQDDVEILFGTGSSNAGDFKIVGVGTGPVLLIDAVSADSGTISIGADDHDVPLTWFGETTGNFIKLTGDQLQVEGAASGAQIALGDGDAILFGDALGTGDITISSTSAVLSIDGTTPGTGSVYIGQNNLDILFKWFGETASSFFQFTGDQLQCDGVQIALDDGDAILFGTTLGTGDFSISDESDVLLITQVSDGTGSVSFSESGEGMDISMFANTAGNYMFLDESAEMFESVGMFVKLDDDSALLFGTKTNITTADGDFEIENVSDTRLNINAVVADSQVCIGDGTVRSDFLIDNATNAAADVWFDASGGTGNEGQFHFGVDNKGVDTIWYGDTANKLVQWDMSVDDWFFGANGEEVDVWFYGAETGDFIQFDGDLTTYGSLVFEDVTINLMDDTAFNLGDSRDVVIDYDSTLAYAEIDGPIAIKDTLCLFDKIPMFSAWQPAATGFTWGGAATGTSGDENVMMFPEATFIYNILGTQTELGPQMRAGGFDISMDDTDNEGLEMCGGDPIVGGAKDNFVVGTAFYMKATVYFTTIAGTDDFWVGFRKVEAFKTDVANAIDTYDTYAAIGLNANAGDFYTQTELNGGVHTATDVTDGGGDWGNGEAHTLEIYVAANGLVTYKIDGDEPTGVVVFDWSDADTVTPFLYFLHANGAQAALTYITRWECGYQ